MNVTVITLYTVKLFDMDLINGNMQRSFSVNYAQLSLNQHSFFISSKSSTDYESYLVLPVEIFQHGKFLDGENFV